MTTIDIDGLPPQPPLPFKAAADYAGTVLAWARMVPSGLQLARNVAYGPDASHRYDVYGAPGQSGVPVLVFWHGGGWTHGHKEWSAFMAEPVAQLGLRLVTPGYRLAPAHRLPAAFEDSLAALRHIAAHARDFGGDPQRIYLAGHSAGGHLAALAALRTADAQQAGVPVEALRGCLPLSAILDLHHPQPPAGSLEERVYSHVLQRPEDDAPMSPLCWTTGNRLPFCLGYGETDSERVARSNQRTAALLALQPGRVRLDCEAGLDHFGTHTRLRDGSAPWYARLAGMVRGEGQ
ncbi:MAG: alpha/beta fold hydrolase [Xenophilus sp.]